MIACAISCGLPYATFRDDGFLSWPMGQRGIGPVQPACMTKSKPPSRLRSPSKSCRVAGSRATSDALDHEQHIMEGYHNLNYGN